MAGISVAAEWQLLYNRYYRKPEIYSLAWKNVDLSRNKVACAPYGGPIAVIRDESKIVQLQAESATRRLRIFNSAGVLIAETPWANSGGRLIGLSWTDDLTLICIVQDGTIYRYNIHGELTDSSGSLGKECFEQSVVECLFWGNGVVCMNEGFQFFCVPEFKNLGPNGAGVVKLADPVLEEPPLSMAVIEPKHTMSGNVEVLLAVSDHVLLVDEDGVQQMGAGVGPLQKMVVSRDGKYLASFTHDGRLLVITTDFSNIIFEYSCESALPPEQLAWCGLDSVLLHWDDSLLMVGPYGDPVNYFYDDPIVLISECDGVRVLSNTSMEFLQRVPDSTVSIFKIGSTTPAALLYDTLDHYDKRSAKADENLRMIKSSLPEAIEACIDAAGYEFDVSRQLTLLRAASYGLTFCCNFPRDRFQEMCKTLRVLNDVRRPVTGIPLSIQQYKELTAPVLIGRLINAYHHLLAVKLSEYLGLNQLVVMHWACTRITTSGAMPDSALLSDLLAKLKLFKGTDYARVAEHADKSGRRKLAAALVEHEPCASKQVPLMLSIEQEDAALTRAIESGDTDLVYFVLFHLLEKKESQLDFFRMIQAKPLARDLFIAYSRCFNHELLKNFFLSTGHLQEVASLLWKESWEISKNPMASKGSPLHGPRIKLVEKTRDLFAETKEHNFESKAADEHAKLLRMQHELEVSTKQAIFVGSSISDTIRTCIVLGNHRAALKVKSEFKVSEKRWYWLKAFALATIRDWDALEKFSKEKRPPNGYKPFVEACIGAGEKIEALKYIPKLADPREQSEAYTQIDMKKEAEEAKLQAYDSGELLSGLGFSFGQTSFFSTIKETLGVP